MIYIYNVCNEYILRIHCNNIKRNNNIFIINFLITIFCILIKCID